MSKSKSIIPEFMSDNPNDTFSFLMPLKINLDKTDYSKSHFNVVVKNLTKNEVFDYEISPEILFTHYPIEQAFKNGKRDESFENFKIKEDTFLINTAVTLKNSYLKDILSEKNIVSLVGWKRKFLFKANYINCYLIEEENYTLIIPQFTIALYYYYRSTIFREAALGCNLENLFISCDCIDNEATILLENKMSYENAALLHRFAYQEKARESFDDIGRLINAYLKSVKEKDNKDLDAVPIKAKFPTKEIFNMKVRTSKLYNEDDIKPYYFVHEILNDYSRIGFKKLTRYLQKNDYIVEVEDLDDLPVLKTEEPEEETEILKRRSASKRLTHKQIEKGKKDSLGSLADVEFESEEITNETIETLIKIIEKSTSSEKVDQSLTESSSSDKEKIRKVVISTKFEKDLEELKPKVNIKNFEKFNQYMDFIQNNDLIKTYDMQRSDLKELPKFIDNETGEINKKCFIYGRIKQYITATFKYKNLYVGLLELENRENTSSSTWVIISKDYIDENIFKIFLKCYCEENLSIAEIKQKYKSNSTLKFKTKNHERIETLAKTNLISWTIGIMGKLIL